MRNRVARRAALAVVLVLVILTTCLYYVFTGHRRMSALTGSATFRIDFADAQHSTDPQILLGAADHFYWLNNGTAAGPLYAKAEKLFSEQGDAPNELHAKVGRLRSEAETMSFVELSRFLKEQLQSPIVQDDKKLRLWCLIAKGYTDIEIDYRAAKRDWLEAQDIAKSLGEDQWVARASGELGLIGFMEGNPGRAARLMGGALISTMASGDVGGQIRFLELLGRGFEEVNRQAEALRFFERAIKLADAEKDAGMPFMAYEGKAQVLMAEEKTDDAKRVLEDALTRARSQRKRGHEAQVLILLGKVAGETGDRDQAITYLEEAGEMATGAQFYSIESDAMFELAKLYRDKGDLATADSRATQRVDSGKVVAMPSPLAGPALVIALVGQARHRPGRSTDLVLKAGHCVSSPSVKSCWQFAHLLPFGT